jgi:hypothetical protein
LALSSIFLIADNIGAGILVIAGKTKVKMASMVRQQSNAIVDARLALLLSCFKNDSKAR